MYQIRLYADISHYFLKAETKTAIFLEFGRLHYYMIEQT